MTQPTQEERFAAIENLIYEVSMLRATGSMLASKNLGEGATKNAVLESFTFHVRNLLHFFHPRHAHPDDALAWHYFSSKQSWQSARGAMPESLEVLKSRVGRGIAHLTYARLAVPPLDPPIIVSAFELVIRRFVENAEG